MPEFCIHLGLLVTLRICMCAYACSCVPKKLVFTPFCIQKDLFLYMQSQMQCIKQPPVLLHHLSPYIHKKTHSCTKLSSQCITIDYTCGSRQCIDDYNRGWQVRPDNRNMHESDSMLQCLQLPKRSWTFLSVLVFTMFPSFTVAMCPVG